MSVGERRAGRGAGCASSFAAEVGLPPGRRSSAAVECTTRPEGSACRRPTAPATAASGPGGSLRPSTAGRIVGGVGRSPAASSQRPSRRRRCHVRPAARPARRVPKRPSPGQRPAAARRRLVRVGDRREAAQNGGPPPRPPWGAQSVVAPSVAPGISARARRGRTALLVLRRGRLEAESSGAVLLRRRRKGCSAGRPRLSARRTSTAHPSDSAAPPRVAFLHEASCQAGEGPRPEKGVGAPENARCSHKRTVTEIFTSQRSAGGRARR